MTVGVWLIGAAGHIGTCVVAGWDAIARGALAPVGMVTMMEPLRALPFADQLAFGGHDLPGRSLRETAKRLIAEGILPQIRDAALDIDLRPATADLATVRADLERFRTQHERVVVVNVATTEAAGDPAPASVVYATAAIELGLGYVNFTPSVGSDTPALHALAQQTGAVHAGSDGKTGQTLVKTALAPLFAIRGLPVESWVSHNILGNDDGRALDDPARRASKQRSKSAALAAILGYAPEASVAIEYVPSYGDWKVAWDRIAFRGFGGASMSLELTWRGSDTALATPLVLDLVRLIELSQRRGERGVLAHLAVFFKSPLGTTEHRLERQWQMLLDHYA